MVTSVAMIWTFVMIIKGDDEVRLQEKIMLPSVTMLKMMMIDDNGFCDNESMITKRKTCVLGIEEVRPRG